MDSERYSDLIRAVEILSEAFEHLAEAIKRMTDALVPYISIDEENEDDHCVKPRRRPSANLHLVKRPPKGLRKFEMKPQRHLPYHRRVYI